MQEDFSTLKGVMCLAAATGDIEMFDFLLKHSDPLTRKKAKNNMPQSLHVAARRGHLRVVQQLFPMVKETTKNDIARKSLLVASTHGHIDTVEYFLKEATFGNLSRPLSVAAQHGHLAIVDTLLGHHVVGIHSKSLALKCAAHNGQLDIVDRLLQEQDDDIDVNHWMSLARAVAGGHRDVVERLLAHPKVDVNHGRPLFLAIFHQHFDIFQRLLQEPNIDVNMINRRPFGHGSVREQCYTNRAPLSIAAEKGRAAFVSALLRHPDIDVNLDTPLQYAAKCGHLEATEARLQHDNILFKKAMQLKHAASRKVVEVVECLLKHPDILVNHGVPRPFEVAAERGHLVVVDAILRHPDVHVNASDGFALTIGTENVKYLHTFLEQSCKITLFCELLFLHFECLLKYPIPARSRWRWKVQQSMTTLLSWTPL